MKIDIGKSIIGNVEKATITIHPEKVPSTSSLVGVSKVGEALESVTPDLPVSKNKTISVQFNPSKLSFSANASETRMTTLQSNFDATIPAFSVTPPSTIMSVELLFDDMDIYDAFTADKLGVATSLSPSAITGAGISAASALAGGFSVKSKTNAFIGILFAEPSAEIEFTWGDLSFFGKIREVSIRYTMFSSSGKPIRSNVGLTLQQSAEESSESKEWDKAVDNCFGEGTKSNKRTAFGNLLPF